MQPTSARLLPLVLFLLAAAVRLPTLSLPVEGESAVLASVADRLGHERGTDLAGRPALMPALAAVLVASGVPATLALRWIDLIFAALLAPLGLLLARRLGAGARAGAWTGVLLALHPLAFVEAGGVQPGSASVAAALLLGALLGLTGAGRGGRRAAACAALLLPFADPYGLLYGPLLFGWALYQEEGRRTRLALALFAVAAVALLPVAGAGLLADWRADGVLAALLWLFLAGAGVLWWGMPAGLSRVWRLGSVPRLWLIAAAAHALVLLGSSRGGAPWALSADGLLLLPLLVCAGVDGLLAAAAPRRVFLVRGAAVAGLCACLWVGFAPGRLHRLEEAMAAAAHVAGERGWIVVAVAGELPDEQSSLADLQPRHWTWADAEPSAAARARAVRVLAPFPASTFETGQRVAVVADAGTQRAIHTFGGAAIFQQEVVSQVGPFVVLRAQRPVAGNEAPGR